MRSQDVLTKSANFTKFTKNSNATNKPRVRAQSPLSFWFYKIEDTRDLWLLKNIAATHTIFHFVSLSCVEWGTAQMILFMYFGGRRGLGTSSPVWSKTSKNLWLDQINTIFTLARLVASGRGTHRCDRCPHLVSCPRFSAQGPTMSMFVIVQSKSLYHCNFAAVRHLSCICLSCLDWAPSIQSRYNWVCTWSP